MSSSCSYPVEMSSNSSSAETESNITEGYSTINDTGLKRNRRLPMPPAFKPPRPKKNFTLCCQSCKELSSYCVGSRLILSIPLLVLAVAGLGVVISLVVTNIKGPEPPPIPPTPEPIRDGGVPEGSNGTLKFVMSPVQNPEVLNLHQERIDQTVTILQNVKLNFTNGTWSFDGREISIGISIIDKRYFQIVLNIYISNSQCRHAGKYFVLISGSNGKAEQSLLYNVTAACPCESEYELNSGRALKCELKVIGNTTVTFNKVSGEIIKPIIYQTGIRIPDNVPETGRFSATWNRSGTLTTRINFSPVQCHDEGNYSLTVTSRLGTQLHYMYVKVKDHPEDPTITIPNGLINGKESELQCQASTGCSKASLTIEDTEPNRQVYMPWGTNLTQNYYQTGGIWKTNVTLILTKFEVDINLLQNKSVRCTYSIDGRNYYSQPILMKVIPDDFCKGKMSKCDYPHPYDCNKYITCTIIPVERICPSGLHFPNSGNCTRNCVYPHEAKCNIEQ